MKILNWNIVLIIPLITLQGCNTIDKDTPPVEEKVGTVAVEEEALTFPGAEGIISHTYSPGASYCHC